MRGSMSNWFLPAAAGSLGAVAVVATLALATLEAQLWSAADAQKQWERFWDPDAAQELQMERAANVVWDTTGSSLRGQPTRDETSTTFRQTPSGSVGLGPRTSRVPAPITPPEVQSPWPLEPPYRQWNIGYSPPDCRWPIEERQGRDGTCNYEPMHDCPAYSGPTLQQAVDAEVIPGGATVTWYHRGDPDTVRIRVGILRWQRGGMDDYQWQEVAVPEGCQEMNVTISGLDEAKYSFVVEYVDQTQVVSKAVPARHRQIGSTQAVQIPAP